MGAMIVSPLHHTSRIYPRRIFVVIQCECVYNCCRILKDIQHVGFRT